MKTQKSSHRASSEASHPRSPRRLGLRRAKRPRGVLQEFIQPWCQVAGAEKYFVELDDEDARGRKNAAPIDCCAVHSVTGPCWKVYHELIVVAVLDNRLKQAAACKRRDHRFQKAAADGD